MRTKDARQIRLAIRSGEALAVIGVKVDSVAFKRATENLPSHLKTAHYVGSARANNRMADYYAARA